MKLKTTCEELPTLCKVSDICPVESNITSNAEDDRWVCQQQQRRQRSYSAIQSRGFLLKRCAAPCSTNQSFEQLLLVDFPPTLHVHLGYAPLLINDHFLKYRELWNEAATRCR